MCGLVGCVGAIGKKEEDAFGLLLMLDTVRGPHSTGVAFIHHKDEPIIAKTEGTPWELIQTDDWRKGMARANAALIGHNRFATKGAINVDNAHPFQHGHIIGAHNGTLRNQSLLKNWKEFEVDSDNIYYDMSVSGHKSTIKRLSGAFALSWYDSFLDTINLCRNSERPLHYTFSKDNKTVFWASETWMLAVALGRCGIDHHEIKELEVGEHVSFQLPDTFPSQVKPFKDYDSEKLDLHTYEYDYRYSYNGGNSERKNEGSVEENGASSNGNNSGNYSTTKSHFSGGKGGSAVALAEGQSFQDLLNYYRAKEFVEFWVEEEVRKPNGGNTAPYIMCRTQDKHGMEVRIYQEPGSPIWRQLAQSREWLKGKVRTANLIAVDRGYITIDPRTLVPLSLAQLSKEGRDSFEEEIAKEEEDNRKPYKGFNGVSLTADAYVQLTNDGCMACNEIAGLADSKLITWIDGSHYICKKCSHDPEIIAMAQEQLSRPTTTVH